MLIDGYLPSCCVLVSFAVSCKVKAEVRYVCMYAGPRNCWSRPSVGVAPTPPQQTHEPPVNSTHYESGQTIPCLPGKIRILKPSPWGQRQGGRVVDIAKQTVSAIPTARGGHVCIFQKQDCHLFPWRRRFLVRHPATPLLSATAPFRPQAAASLLSNRESPFADCSL